MDKNMTLEQANDLLDQTVARLENEALPFGESVELYTEACELMAFCVEQLENCKGKIENANQKLAQLTTEGESI